MGARERQIDCLAVEVELPRWSPMASELPPWVPRKPYRGQRDRSAGALRVADHVDGLE